MLNIKDSILLIIDLQEKLVKVAQKNNMIVNNCEKLLKAASILEVPVIITEQYPKGLGKTVVDINEDIIEKTTFSCMQEEKFKERITHINRSQVIICGIETHICVLQTAYDLIYAGYEVYIAKNCTASRSDEEYNTGIELLKQYGAKITSCEITLFEWLKTSKHPKFKEIQSLIK